MVGKHVIIDLYDVEPNLMANINNNDILTNKWNNLIFPKSTYITKIKFDIIIVKTS